METATIEQNRRISFNEMCFNILANVTSYTQFNERTLQNHIKISKIRRQAFNGHDSECMRINSAIETNILKDNQEVKHLIKTRNILSENAKQNINLRCIDIYFVICIVLSLILMSLFVIYSAPLIIFMVLAPLLVLFLKCLHIEISTRRFSTISNYLMGLHIPIEEKQEVAKEDALLTCITILYKQNMINVLDEDLLNIPHTTTYMFTWSQVKIATHLVYYIKQGKISIKTNSSSQSALANCISKNMQRVGVKKIDANSFKKEFNRVLKATESDYRKLLEKHMLIETKRF